MLGMSRRKRDEGRGTKDEGRGTLWGRYDVVGMSFDWDV